MSNKTIDPAKAEDMTGLGAPSALALEAAIKNLCPDFEGAGVWEKVQKKYGIAPAGTTAHDATNAAAGLNAAIADWQNAQPITDCAGVKAAFNL